MDYGEFLERTDFHTNVYSAVYTMHFYVTKSDLEEMSKRRKIKVNGRRYKVIGIPISVWSVYDTTEKRLVKLDLEQIR